MNVVEYTLPNRTLARWVWIRKEDTTNHATPVPSHVPFDLLRPFRQWLDHLEVNNPDLARFLCRAIPTQCPFARTIKLFGRTLFEIPPLCKLNPLYNEVVALRFRALCYLADVCGEDVTPYC